jgi:hypothetical protein
MSNEGSQITPAELAYFEAHASDNLGPNIIASNVITAVFSTFFVVLRVIGRRLTNNSLRLHSSDWLLIVAWACSSYRSKVDSESRLSNLRG